MRDVKEVARLTNAYIAEKAEVSTKTIERIMAINCDQDIMRAIARRIELVVIGPVGAHTCFLDHDGASTERISSLLQEVETENEQLKARLREIDEQHRKDIRAVKEEYTEQIAFLKEEVKVWRDLHQNK